MSKYEKVIQVLQDASKDVERLAKLKSIEEPVESKTHSNIAFLHAQKAFNNAIQVARDAFKSRTARSVKMKFDTLKYIGKNTKAFRHSSTGGTRTQRDILAYSQRNISPTRGGQRFFEAFPGERRSDLATVRVIRPSPGTPFNNANVVGEGASKPAREWQLQVQTVPATKIAVTDVVTDEFIRLLPDDELLDFLVLAHTENVLDALDIQIHALATTFGNVTPFSPVTFNNVLNPAGVGIQSGIRWHDFLAAIAMYFKFSLEDTVAGIEFPDLWLASTNPTNAYYGILQDREPDAAYLHKNHDVERWYNQFTPNNIFPSETVSGRIIALNRDAFRLDIHDDVIVSFERIADANDERNLFRLTVEIYFWFYSLYDPPKAVTADINDITNIS